MIRAFVDANVLFSAAWREGAGVARIWQLPDVVLLTSAFALEEARRNLVTPERRARLQQLADLVGIVPEGVHIALGEFSSLRAKDQPILQAAILARATHMVTGDWRDFGPWMGGEMRGVKVVTPAAFLAERSEL